MNRKKIVMIIIVLLLVATVWIIMWVMGSKGGSLISPGLGEAVGNVVSQSTPQPSVSTFNAPKEIKYGSATDLKQELDSINPQVLDSDFED
ncbi:MAG: hypothetical protein Q7R82_00810 [Candidatus Daviesbacteria bacterium]|nr:hypothetical protein [Candidatus Daviesbacteria bacterium]